ncbi:MAG: SUMF1/EgtB/PvdO family nonheme iron enzyme [Rikenellaceae bacterium]
MKRLILTIAFALSGFWLGAQENDQWKDHILGEKAKMLENVSASLPFVSPQYNSGDQPGTMDLNITGVNDLILSVWGTADGDDYDHAAWAGAVLIDKDGKEYLLEDETFELMQVNGDWFVKAANFSGNPISIGKKVYKTGLITHAQALMVLNVEGRNLVRFKSDLGVDNGSAHGTVVFKVMSTSGEKEAAELLAQYPQAAEIFSLFNVKCADWLTSPFLFAEKSALNTIGANLSSRWFVDQELERIETLSSEREKLDACIALAKRGYRALAIQEQIGWIDMVAIRDAFADFSSMKGYDKATYQAKLDRLTALYNEGFADLAGLSDAAIDRAERALNLKKEILFSNPVLDFDRIITTRFTLGSSARAVGAQEMGTPSSNFASLLSTRRTGYDVQISELSGLREAQRSERQIYKPDNDGYISEVDLHWDGQKMLFTGINELQQLQLYEVNVDGSGARRVTNFTEDTDLEFFDAAYLPSGKIMTASNIAYNGVPCINGFDHVSCYNLFDPETGALRRLTFDQDCNWAATILQNGKVLYTRWEYTDLMHYYSRIVMTMNPDGTEQKAYFGSGAMFPNATYDMQQLPENHNRFVGVISGHHGVCRSGRLIIFDPTKARKGVEGMVQEIPFGREPIKVVEEDEMVKDVWPQFTTPHPITDKYFLVTAKPSPNALWGIYLVDVFDNMTLIAEYEGEGIMNPIPLRKRSTPVVIPEKVPMEIADTPQQATVFIQDIYEGEGLVGVPRGTVKEFRVLSYEYAYLDTTSDHVNNGIQAGWDIKRELGRVKVNEDGSALFMIPANTPISLQPLDSTGAAIQLMRSWFVGMPGEVVSCVGCHEDQNKIAKPVRTMASQQQPLQITAPVGGLRPYTFEGEVQPILDRACVACHNGEKLAGGIDYTGNRFDTLQDWTGPRIWSKAYLQFHPYFYRQGPEAEMAVLNPYEYNVSNSEMIQLLRKGHHGVELTDYEWNRLITWVDFNVPYGGVFDAIPFEALDGKTYDQKRRRVELNAKYAGNPVDWVGELEKFEQYLASQPEIEPVMPKKPTVSTKNLSVKGWPFSAEEAQQMVEGKEKKVVDLGDGLTMTFVYIPRGTYIAGGNGLNGQSIPRKVTIKKGFWMAEKEVSNEQMRAMVPTHSSRYIGQQWKDHTTPGYFVDSNHYAATKISYNDAMLFNERLSAKTGLNVTLPSEDQWEWAARAGSDDAFWFGSKNADFSPYENLADKELDKMAVSGIDPQPMSEESGWFKYQAYIPKDRTVNDGNMLMTASGEYKASPWGLYDINGNVAEWTRSSGNGQLYIVKGGSWYDRAKKVTVADRREFLPWHQVWNVGFRPIIEE